MDRASISTVCILHWSMMPFNAFALYHIPPLATKPIVKPSSRRELGIPYLACRKPIYLALQEIYPIQPHPSQLQSLNSMHTQNETSLLGHTIPP